MGAAIRTSSSADGSRKKRDTRPWRAGKRLADCLSGVCCCKQALLGDESFWDKSYARGEYREHFEWIQTCDAVWPFLMDALGGNKQKRILHVGCGNSDMGRRLHEAGYCDVTNVDYSAEVISMMQRQQPALRWVRADCSEHGALGAADAYDLCVDKGALDSLFESYTDAMRARGWAFVREVHRVIRPGGIYILFSNAAVGMPALEEIFASCEGEAIEGYSCDLYYKQMFVITCKK